MHCFLLVKDMLKALISKYAPITYLDKDDPPFFYGKEVKMTKFHQ
jgi:hypothetical protein